MKGKGKGGQRWPYKILKIFNVKNMIIVLYNLGGRHRWKEMGQDFKSTQLSGIGKYHEKQTQA